MKHQLTVDVGPRRFRIGSDWRAPIATLSSLYAPYPQPRESIPDYTVRLEAPALLRRWLRPAVAISGDYVVPEALPVALPHALLAAEMAMNLQMALGERRFLLLHASSVEKNGKVLIMTGESGSGKSTLSALLGSQGWRFMGDEFALIDPETGLAHPFPRPVSLKNQSVAVMQARLPTARFGPLLMGTPKGDIRHLVPANEAIAAMTVAAPPALILFPRFGAERDVRMMGQSEVFVRLTQASTNYVSLAQAGHSALTRLVTSVPARAIDYPDTDTALALVDNLWRTLT
ncbi:MAG: HprK-related kinase A [Sphingomonadaceae bacterium]